MQSTEKPLLKFADAHAVAEEVMHVFQEDVHRIEIGGSVRRQRMHVHDLELVLIPRTVVLETNVLGETTQAGSAVRARIPELVERGIVQARLDKRGRQSMGQITQKLLWRGFPLDLFAATKENFGLKLAVYTGPWCLSKWFVTKRGHGGACPPDVYMKDFNLWRAGESAHAPDLLIPTPEESDFFAAIGVPYIAPELRDRRLEELVSRGWKCEKKVKKK